MGVVLPIALRHMREHILTSLAILKVNFDHGHDYIENFVPFVAECLRQQPSDVVSIPDLQNDILVRFGIRIPQAALRTILNRAVRRGYAERVTGIFRRDSAALTAINLAAIRDGVLRQHEALIDKLVEFTKTHHGPNLSHEDAEAAILSFIQEQSVPILAAAVDGEPVSSPKVEVNRTQYLVGDFIVNLYERDPEGFEHLEAIVKGSMLANVLYYPELGQVQQRFERVEVYFDTPFLLRAIGLRGPWIQANCRELLDLLYEQGGLLFYFDHTFEETIGVIDAASHGLRDRTAIRHSHGQMFEHILGAGYRASDLEMMTARLEQTLRGLRLKLRSRPPYSHQLGVDEDKLEAKIREEVTYRRDEALKHDLDSLTAIHRLRRGEFPSRLELSKAIFVTTNSALAKASSRFFAAEYHVQQGSRVPHCILDHVLATLVWLKAPLKAPDLPRKRIIADSYAALNPDDMLWKQYLDEIDRLDRTGKISADDYHLLRFSMEARTALMDVTLGDEGTFAEGTVEEVLERARSVARRRVEIERDEEKGKRARAEEVARTAEEALTAQENILIQRIQYLARLVGFWSSRFLQYGLTIVVVAGTLLSFPGMPMTFANAPSFLLPAMFLIFSVLGVLSILNVLIGTTVRSWVTSTESYVAGVTEKALWKMLGKK